MLSAIGRDPDLEKCLLVEGAKNSNGFEGSVEVVVIRGSQGTYCFIR